MHDPEAQPGPPATSRHPPSPVLDRLLRSLIAHLPAATAVTAVVLFVALRVAYQRFYEPLGIRPEEAGIAYTTPLAEVAAAAVALVIALLVIAFAVLLALAVLLVSPLFMAAAVSLVLILMIALLYALLIYILLLPLMTALVSSKRLIRHPQYTAWVDSMVRTKEIHIRFGMVDAQMEQGEPRPRSAPTGDADSAGGERASKSRDGASDQGVLANASTWGGYTTVVRWLTYHAVHLTAMRAMWTAARSRPRRARTAAFAMGALALVGLAGYVWNAAGQRADDIAQGQAADPVRILHIEVLSIGGQPTEATWIGEPSPSAFSADCYVNVGRASGMLVLYDPRADRVLHIPDNDVVMADRSHC